MLGLLDIDRLRNTSQDLGLGVLVLAVTDPQVVPALLLLDEDVAVGSGDDQVCGVLADRELVLNLPGLLAALGTTGPRNNASPGRKPRQTLAFFLPVA